jgi:DNA polymerase-1
MGIGEAPGEREDDIRKPFQGRSGQMLMRILRGRYGISRDMIYLSNAVKCRPPKNETPRMKEIRACRDYLLEEVERVKPKKILAFGSIAIRSVLEDNRAGIGKNRFQVIHFPEFPDIPVYPTYHPAAILHDPYKEKLFKEDLAFAFETKNRTYKKKYWLVNDNEEAWKIVKYATTRREIAVDFETTGLKTLLPSFKILTMSICWKPGLSYCIAIEHPESKVSEYIKMLKYLFEKNKNTVIGGHNIKYEIKCLLAYGVPTKCDIRDTMLEFGLLDENYPGKSLYVLKLRYTDDLGLKEQKIKPYMDNLIELPLKKIAAYNCEDTDATCRLMKKFVRPLTESDLIPLSIFQQETTKMLAEVETTGMKIDQTLLRKNIKLFEKKKRIIESSLPGINFNSPEQLGNLLYGKLGIKMRNKTKSGWGSTAREDLEIITRTREGKKHKGLIEKIINYKKLSHFDSHFVTGIYIALQPDGKIYPTYNIVKHEGPRKKEVGTVTGRLSASLIHQVPRDTDELDKLFGKETIQIKEMFISSFDNGCITQGDYSQVELRLMAEYSQDENMLQDFESGEDIHAAVTHRVMKRAPQYYRKFTEFSDKRKKTKAVNFGIIYLISPWGLAEKLESSVEEAKALMREWFHIYPGVKKWLLKMQRQVIRDQQTVSLIGRIRRVPGADFNSTRGRELIRQGINALMQGLASDINLMLMIELQEEYKKRKMKSRIIGNVHDATLTDTHPKEKKEVKRIYEKMAPKPKMLEDLFDVELTVPITMNVVQKATWSKRE